MKNILCLLSDGFEEIEAICPIDLLHRAGAKVTLVSIASKSLIVVGRSGISITSEISFDELFSKANNSFCDIAKSFDALLLPGGPSTFKLLEDKRASQIAIAFHKEKKLIAAICAAPLILNQAELLNGKRVAAHSCTWETIPQAKNANSFEFDDMILTSKGAGTAFEFGLQCVAILYSPDVAKRIAVETMSQNTIL